jgi:hydrogenase maturation protein HypF
MFNVEQISSHLRPRVSILALGADTRQRVSWTLRVHGAQSQKIYSLSPKKDLNDTREFYFQAARLLKQKFCLRPDVITFDPHPNFVCKKEADAIRRAYFPKARLAPIFHHIAHAANYGIEVGTGQFIALTFDGTGFGQDGNVWGGEFFAYQDKQFERLAHFEYQVLSGSEAAIREPWRMALGILIKIYPDVTTRGKRGMKFKFLEGVPIQKAAIVRQMVEKRFNAPLTSSVGRIFDAVCAVLGLKTVVVKEAEAAVLLEKAAARYKLRAQSYYIDIKQKNGVLIIGTTPIFKEIVKDLALNEPVEKIAYRFHITLANIIHKTSLKLSAKTGISDIYFSGGVFMNNILVDEIRKVFKPDDLGLFFAKRPQTTDLGISQGQIAAYCMEKH